MRLLLFALIALALPAAPPRPVSMATGPVLMPIAESGELPAYVSGELIVGFRAEAASKRATRAADVARAFDLELVRMDALDRIGAVKVRMRAGGDEGVVAARLAQLPDVDYVERNALFYPASRPTDPLYEGVDSIETDLQRWYFGGAGQNRVLDAESAWDLTKGDPKVVIAIIDSGTDIDNVELRNLWVNRREQAGNGIDDDHNGYIDDIHGFDFYNGRGDVNPELGDGVDNNGEGQADETTAHGTIVASIIGSSHDDGVGMVGAAPQCSIMTVKVFGDERGVPADTLIESIHYAVDNGAEVINMSLVSYVNSKSVRLATNYAWRKNVVLVAAAGNANDDYLQFPATYATVIGVGGSDSGFDGRVLFGEAEGRWPRTQYGPSVDVVAPAVVLGASVVSTGRNLAEPSLAVGATAYDIVSGTSYAAPLVAALAGLVIAYDVQLHGSRTLSNDDVQALIKRTAQPLENDYNDVPDAGFYWAGSGRINFAAALAKIPGASAPDPVVTSAEFAKGSLEIYGDGFSRESVVEINDTVVSLPVAFSFTNGTLDVKGSRKSLRLQKNAVNRIVVVERGVRSPVYELQL
jgi:subtilisin family serine protease